MLASLGALLALSLVLEWTGARVVPGWDRARWVVLPTCGVVLMHFMPLGVFGMSGALETFTSTMAGIVFPLLFALHGAFSAAFWNGPSEAELAATGMRSVLQGPARPAHRMAGRPMPSPLRQRR